MEETIAKLSGELELLSEVQKEVQEKKRKMEIQKKNRQQQQLVLIKRNQWVDRLKYKLTEFASKEDFKVLGDKIDGLKTTAVEKYERPHLRTLFKKGLLDDIFRNLTTHMKKALKECWMNNENEDFRDFYIHCERLWNGVE